MRATMYTWTITITGLSWPGSFWISKHFARAPSELTENILQLKNAKLRKGETIARYSSGVMIGKWKDKRDVAYISTEFENQMVDVQTKRNETSRKPLPITKYNAYMSGIDRQDQMMSYYLSEWKTIRWPKMLFFIFWSYCCTIPIIYFANILGRKYLSTIIELLWLGNCYQL